MINPISRGAIEVASGIVALGGITPVPGLGALTVNAYLLEGDQPVLVDAGLPALANETVDALASRIDLDSLRWIWITHCDADHVGALDIILQRAPAARVVTNYLGMGKLSMRTPLAPERVYLINPGQMLDVGDRVLRVLAMPSYDAPETMGLYDSTSRALFSSDCFGALLSDNEAAANEANTISRRRLRDGIITWSTVDAPWLHQADAASFATSMRQLVDLEPEIVLSAHCPPARGMTHWLADQVGAARSAPPFVGPDQAALEAMLGAAA